MQRGVLFVDEIQAGDNEQQHRAHRTGQAKDQVAREWSNESKERRDKKRDC